MVRKGVAIVCGAMLLVVAQGLSAGEPAALTPDQERRAAALYEELKCPVCKSQSVAASTSFLSEEMKRQIRDMLAAGQTDQQIIDHFVTRYGDWILMRPKLGGQGLWAWIVPGLAVFVAATLLALRLRRWSKPQAALPTATSTTTELNDEARRKIESLVQG